MIFLYSVPFGLFLIYELGQNTDCSNIINISKTIYLSGCQVGIPDIFRHSLYYDYFFLRGGVGLIGSHWSSQLFLPLLYFACLIISKGNYKFSFIMAFFYLFYHESQWSLFQLIYNGGEYIADFVWILILCAGMALSIFCYHKFFLKKEFAILTSIYWFYLEYWQIVDSLRVTIVGTGPTIWYYSFVTNFFEVNGWALCLAILLAYTFIFRKEIYDKEYLSIQELTTNSRNYLQNREHQSKVRIYAQIGFIVLNRALHLVLNAYREVNRLNWQIQQTA